MNIPESYNHFQLYAKTECPPWATIVEYMSMYSGVRVMAVIMDSPIVDGIFLVPTQASDDSGCAHTLEHLIFLGSEKYPRCLANGTNAWTEIDHTAYTISTAGFDGFLNIIGVYLDHILYPSLTQETFLTEVYHTTPAGLDNGVVFSEMAGVEYDADSIIDRECRQALYSYNSFYSYETGGRIDKIRELTLDQIKEFHKKFYRWNNLTILVRGKVRILELLDHIASIEIEYAKIGSSKFIAEPVPKPILAPQLTWSNLIIHTKFPNDDNADNKGKVVLCWRGPNWSDFRERLIIEILGEYLAYGNASPLQKQFVDVLDSIASDVTLEEQLFTDIMYVLSFHGVSKKAINQVLPLYNDIVTQEVKKGVDLDRVKAIALRSLYTVYQRLEEEPDTAFLIPLIEYVVNMRIYGHESQETFQKLWKFETLIRELITEPQEFWNTKLKQYFLSKAPCLVSSIPCSKMSRTIKQETDKRITANLEFFRKNPSVYEKYVADLEHAKKTRLETAPDEIIKKFPISSIDSVYRYNYNSYTNMGNITAHKSDEDKIIQEAIQKLNLPIFYSNIPSKSVTLQLTFEIPSSKGSEDLHYLIPLLTQMLFELGATLPDLNYIKNDSARSNTTISHEVATQLLLEYTTTYEAGLGPETAKPHGSLVPNYFSLKFTCHPDKLLQAAEIITIILYHLNFTEDRTKFVAQAMLTEMVQGKRRAKIVAATHHSHLRFHPSSIRLKQSLLSQHGTFIQINENPKHYTNELKRLYKQLFASKAILSVVGNYEYISSRFKSLASVFSMLTREEFHKQSLPEYLNVSLTVQDHLEDSAPLPHGNAVISCCSSQDTQAMIVSIPAKADYKHPDAPALLVLQELLSSCQGPLFNAVRGSGAAYSISCTHSRYLGQMILKIMNAMDVDKAFTKSIEVFQNLIESPVEPIEVSLEAAKCTALYDTIRSEATMSNFAVEQLFLAFFGIDLDYNYQLIKRISNLKPNEILEVAKKYLPLFINCRTSPTKYLGSVAISISANKKTIDEVKNKFKFLKQDESYDGLPADNLTKVVWGEEVIRLLNLDDKYTNQILVGSDTSDDDQDYSSDEDRKSLFF